MNNSVVIEFGDFFYELFEKHLINNHVIYIKNLGYFFISYRQPRTGRNPKTGEKIFLAGKNRLTFFTKPDDYTEDDLVESLARNNIVYVEKKFPSLSQLLSLLDKKAATIEIISSKGKKLLRFSIRKKPDRTGRLPNGDRVTLSYPDEVTFLASIELKHTINLLSPAILIDEEIDDVETGTGVRAIGLTTVDKTTND